MGILKLVGSATSKIRDKKHSGFRLYFWISDVISYCNILEQQKRITNRY